MTVPLEKHHLIIPVIIRWSVVSSSLTTTIIPIIVTAIILMVRRAGVRRFPVFRPAAPDIRRGRGVRPGAIGINSLVESTHAGAMTDDCAGDRWPGGLYCAATRTVTVVIMVDGLEVLRGLAVQDLLMLLLSGRRILVMTIMMHALTTAGDTIRRSDGGWRCWGRGWRPSGHASVGRLVEFKLAREDVVAFVAAFVTMSIAMFGRSMVVVIHLRLLDLLGLFVDDAVLASGCLTRVSIIV